jgi:hypothetical protein
MAQREVTAEEMVDAAIAGAAAIVSDPRRWWHHKRELADGRVLYLVPNFTPGCYRLGVSRDGRADDYELVLDYNDSDAAWRAVLGWDGEGDPEGWVRFWAYGQIPRRRPDGTPASEFVAP